MSFLNRAYEAWPVGEMPEWVHVLAVACDDKSQNKLGSILNINPAYISYALRNIRPEFHQQVEDAVRARLLSETVSCPVLGEDTPLSACRTLRKGLETNGFSPIQKLAHRACPTCQHNINGRME